MGDATFIKNLISKYSFHVIGIQETMIKDCDKKLLKKFDINQDCLWLYNSTLGKSSGILCGVKKDLYDVGSFHQGKYMLQMNL
jgi:hypothetical protein